MALSWHFGSRTAGLVLPALPGSKTLQLLDLMHAGLPPGAVPAGVLVANDANRSRLVTVAQRSRRQPRSPLLLIATDARRIPCIKKPRGY